MYALSFAHDPQTMRWTGYQPDGTPAGYIRASRRYDGAFEAWVFSPEGERRQPSRSAGQAFDLAVAQWLLVEAWAFQFGRR